MKKIKEKQLLFATYCRPGLTIMVKMCIVFLICTITAVSSDVKASVSGSPSDSYPAMTEFNDLQQDFVSGTIKDASTGEPLIGVTVMVKGTTLGTLTDINGQFSLRLPERQATLAVSFIGYATQEIAVNQGSSINVSMQLEVTQIQEVVVVGYGVQKKESVVGAITQVNNATLMKSGTANVTNAIAGKLSGVLTIQQTGEPGANQSEIVVRGLSSWNGSQPLVLVDGVERNFNNIDPNEINTISVLKDASATAVFGAKGANGVIIVTTKRGSLGKPKLDFSSSVGFQRATRLPEHIDSYTTMSLYNEALSNDQKWTLRLPESVLAEYANPSSPLNELRYPDVDWFDLLSIPMSPTANANLNITGGTNFVKYFASFGYQYEGSFFKGYKNGYDDTRFKSNRFNYRANVDFSLTKSSLLSLNLGGDISIRNTPVISTIWQSLYRTGPSRFPAYFPEWVVEEVPDLDYPDASGVRYAQAFGEMWGNPYTLLNNGSFRNYLGSTMFTDLIFDQKLDKILKGLSFRGKVSLSTYYNHLSLYADYTFPEYMLDYNKIGVDANSDGKVDSNPWTRNGQGPEVYVLRPIDINVGGLETGYYTDLYYEGAINYSNSFGKHSVTAMALINRQQKNSVLDFPYYNEALVGRATYDYSRKYLLELNIGYTGSERFAPGNRFGFFPSGAIGWTVSEEPFFKNSVPWMNKLKVRYSEGLVGSDYASSRWLYISDYTETSGYIYEDKGANVNAQWEEARKRDVGVEIGIFKNLFTFNVDLFDEYREKMLLTPRSVTRLVGNSFKDLNLGSLKKHGIEIEAEYNKTTSGKLNYYIRGIFGFNENRIVYKDDLPYAPEYVKDEGKPLGGQLSGVLLTGSGYFTSVDDLHNKTAPVALNLLNPGDYKFLDYNADGAITSKDKYPIKGSDYPPITYSFAGGFSYKGFDLNILFQGNVGKYVVWNNAFESEFLAGNWIVHKTQLDYWTPTNQDANHCTLHYYTGGGGIPQLAWSGGAAYEGYNGRIENRFWRNADYLRLKDIYAAYTFNSAFLNRVAGVEGLNIYATANNLLTFTKLVGGDPERKDFATGFYPLMVTVKFGMKVVF
jgi:TonB-linked SusC/RagA family outer membrane protein